MDDTIGYLFFWILRKELVLSHQSKQMTDPNLYTEDIITWTGLVQAHDLPCWDPGGCLEERRRREEGAELGLGCSSCRSPWGQHTRATGGESLLPSLGTQSQKDSHAKGISQVHREKIIMFWVILLVPILSHQW